MKNIIPYSVALLLKQLGYKERSNYYFENKKHKLHNNIFGWDFNSSFLECCSAAHINDVLNWFEETHSLYCEFLIDGYGEDSKISDEHICYRLFIWEIGKPKPNVSDDYGANVSDKIKLVAISECINFIKNGK